MFWEKENGHSNSKIDHFKFDVELSINGILCILKAKFYPFNQNCFITESNGKSILELASIN